MFVYFIGIPIKPIEEVALGVHGLTVAKRDLSPVDNTGSQVSAHGNFVDWYRISVISAGSSNINLPGGIS